jgi:hypothetical protein
MTEMDRMLERLGARGKALALKFLDSMSPDEFDAPVVAHALAYAYAALMVSVDGQLTVHENAGMGLLGDDERLALFCQEVKELATFMRTQRKATDMGTPAKGVM